MRDVLLAGVIAAAEGVEGRVKLQKMIYLLQRMGYRLGFDDFILLHYGPYSADLANTVDLASTGVLNETTHTGGPAGSPIIQYVYDVRPEIREVVDRVLHATFRDRGDDLCRRSAEMSRRNARVLEVAATAVYLRDEMGISDEDRLWREVKGRKSHLAKHFDKAKNLLADWDARGLLRR